MTAEPAVLSRYITNCNWVSLTLWLYISPIEPRGLINAIEPIERIDLCRSIGPLRRIEAIEPIEPKSLLIL